MGFYLVTDLMNILNCSKSKAYDEIKECNAILKNKYGVERTYSGRIRKDLYDLLTGLPKKMEV